MKDEFSTFQVAKAIGEKYQRLRGWIDTGAITPSIQLADGVGVKAKFSRIDVYCIGLFKELLAQGFSREEAGARTRSLKSVLMAEKIMRDQGKEFEPVEHILFVKYDGTFLAPYEHPNYINSKFYKSIREALADSFEEPLRVFALSQRMFKELSLSELFSFKGRHSSDGQGSYQSIVIINLGQIIRNIDIALG